jgi:hypothetical protein
MLSVLAQSDKLAGNISNSSLFFQTASNEKIKFYKVDTRWRPLVDSPEALGAFDGLDETITKLLIALIRRQVQSENFDNKMSHSYSGKELVLPVYQNSVRHCVITSMLV